ncbi:MFS transporter [Tsukamurella soli]|uniref:MFS transporter n=1 Tax=Tsukamurella soli TaxID=644556 RepID=A0ABP8K9V9_9ACTN
MTENRRGAAPLLLACSIGQVIEWYDFFIYGTASALVFGRVFFPSTAPLAGTLLSYATFGVAFLARPLGGILFGHFGDRFGRKPTLVVTFLIMGTATGAVGLLPSYHAIGVWAPLILVGLRVLQGLSLGGEYAGAVLMSVEHAPPGRRSYFGSWVQAGSPAGVVLSNSVFLLTSTYFPDALANWGWRVPFLASFALVIVGIIMRVRVQESPAFQAVAAARSERSPILTVLRNHKRAVLLTAGSYLSIGAVTYTSTVFGISWGKGTLGYSYADVLGIIIVGQVVCFAVMPIFGVLGDRVGTAKVCMVGIVGCAVVVFPWLALVGTGDPWLAVIGYTLLAFPYAANYSVMAAFFAAAYETRVGYTGFSLGYQLGTVVGSGLAPTIATALLAATGTVDSVGWYIVAFCAVSLVSTALLARSRPVSTLTSTRPARVDVASPLQERSRS